MSPRPAAAPNDATALDDFEWPPKGDELTIHEIAADPWRPAKKGAVPAPKVKVTLTVDRGAAPAHPSVRPAAWRRNR